MLQALISPFLSWVENIEIRVSRLTQAHPNQIKSLPVSNLRRHSQPVQDPQSVDLGSAPLRVLIVAEHASMQFGGEAALPVHYFRLLRQRGIETWLVVHERTRSELLAEFPNDSHRIYFVPDTIWHRILAAASPYLPRKLSEITFGIVMKLLTELHQRPVIRHLVKLQHIDVIHQPIYVSPKTPSLIFGLGAPVVIGPLNGGMTYPPAFHRSEGRIVRQIVALGRMLSNGLNLIIPGKRLADTVLVANRRTREALPLGVRGKVIELVENGVDTELWQSAPTSDHVLTRFVFLGRLVDWKAVDLLLLAFQQVLQQVPAKLEIIGDGPARPSLQQLSQELKLLGVDPITGQPAVQFSGWLSQERCVQQLQQSDVLVLPSLFESGGAVVLEAMAVGLPVVATHWGGPVDYVDASCGILVDPSSKNYLIEQLAAAMVKLSLAPELRRQMGEAGRERVRKYYDWQRKIDAIVEIYRETISRSKTKPAKSF
jgi:glycosyltransferase involved in cell wall biosynthesis